MITKQLTFTFEEDESLNDYIILPSDPRWPEAFEKFRNTKVFGLDFETYGPGKAGGLDWWNGRIRLMQIGLPTGEALVVDLGSWETKEREEFIKNRDFLLLFIDKIKDRSVIKIGQNLLFEQSWCLSKFKAPMRNIRDTELLARVYWAGVESISPKKFPYDLGSIAKRFGLEASKELQRSDWGWELSNAQINYAANDAIVVLEIVKKIKPLLIEAKLWEHAVRESNASPAFAMMQYYGMPVNLEKLEEVLKQYLQVREEVIQPFKEDFPGVDYGSTQKVAAAANEKYHLGLSSTDKENLADIDMPWAKALSLWRSLGKSIDYLSLPAKESGIKELVRDGFVRSNYKIIAPKGHGRTASRSPNLQNAPNPSNEMIKLGLPSVRVIFEAPKGYKMIVADLSQAHARIAAEASKDKMLLASYNEGYDTHAITASKLAEIRGMGEDWTHQNIAKWKKDHSHENHTEANYLRQLAKPVFYGSLNGQGAKTLKDTAATDGVFMTIEEAQEAIAAWRAAYNDLYKFQIKVNELGNSNTEVILGKTYGIVHGLSGRRLFLEKYPSKYGPPAIKFTDAIAFVWMSTEADVMKEALVRLVDLIDEHPEWDAKLGNLGHDEIDLVCKEEYSSIVDKEVIRVMDDCMRLWIKSIPVNDPNPCGICTNWAEGK